MKKLILFLIICYLGLSINGQEIFKIPEPTLEAKHTRMVLMFWANIAPGIKFAKEQNVSPFEYGVYYGKLFGSNRNTDAGFIGYAQSIINSWAHFIRNSDEKMVIETESDSLLIYKVPSNILTDFFGKEGFVGISADDMIQMMNGSHSKISDQYGCTSKMVHKGEWIVGTIRKN